MGALIGQNVPTPGLAFAVGVASHFILDLIPHGDSKLYHGYKSGESVRKSVTYVVIDSLFSIAIFIYLLEVAPYASRGTLIAGVVGGVAPDALVALGEGVRTRLLHRFQHLHIRIHDAVVNRVGNIPLRVGVLMQIVLLWALVLVVRH